MKAPGKCDVHAITQVIASRSYSSPERQSSKNALGRPTRSGPGIGGLKPQRYLAATCGTPNNWIASAYRL